VSVFTILHIERLEFVLGETMLPLWLGAWLRLCETNNNQG